MLLKKKIKLCTISNIEETVNGYICKSLDGKTCKFYKTHLYEVNSLMQIKEEKKRENIKKVLWNGVTYEDFFKKK